MPITKSKPVASRASPPTTKNPVRPLTGRIIVGLLTGDELPDKDHIVTSAKDRR